MRYTKRNNFVCQPGQFLKILWMLKFRRDDLKNFLVFMQLVGVSRIPYLISNKKNYK